MKVLHINSYYIGSDLYRNMYEYQVKAGISICIYVPTLNNFPKDEYMDNPYVIVSPCFNQADRYFFYSKQKKIIKDLYLNVNVRDYSIIHAHSLFSNGYAAMKIKEKTGTPYIVAIRNTDLNFFLKHMIHLRRVGIDIMRHADRLVFLSEPYMRKTIESYVPSHEQSLMREKSIVIPNGIDSFWHQNINKPKLMQPGSLRLLEVGNINKNKNQVKVIEVAEELRKRGHKIDLTFVGKSMDAKLLDQILHKDKAAYKPAMPKEQLLNEYRKNDVFIMPSLHETFGLVYAEALSQGLPIIFTRGQGFDGHFEDGYVGYSVDTENTVEIVDRIVDIMDDYSAISSRAIQASKKFDWKRIVREYLLLYSSMEQDK